jgi:hypothetical protein
MTAISVTADKVARARPQDDEVLPVVLAETVAAGDPAYQATSGKFGLCDANDSGKQQFRGIFLEAGGVNQVVPLLKRGLVAGYDVSSMNGDAILYVSDTVAKLDTATGTLEVHAGRVMLGPDGTTKLAYIDADWTIVWA